jgi:hypothetical protein
MFDSTVPAPSPVLGFYDTEAQPQVNLVTLTDAQWASRTNGYWAVVRGQLVPYTPPPGAAWQVALAAEIAGGITLTSAGTPALDAVYALDSTSTAQVFQLGTYAAQFGVFPDQTTTFQYPDATGAPHAFPVAAFIAFFHAVALFVTVVNQQAQIMRGGGTPSWPSSSVTID